jgi:hypothetical protein
LATTLAWRSAEPMVGGGETEEVGVWNVCGRFEVGDAEAT